ncbi:MAG TPA: HAMP domain-containing sensor histidine kinase [Actinomycetota bacterium]|nr:HAMP domain-containing sensor histidine kinase [Actinomycetota bacterium]
MGAIASGALAGASFLVVRQVRLQESLDRGLERAQTNFLLADRSLDSGPDPEEIDDLFSTYSRAGLEAIVLTGGQALATSPQLRDTSFIPSSLRDDLQEQEPAHERTVIEGTPYLFVGQIVEGTDLELYFAFREAGVQRLISELGKVLLIGWLVLVAASGVVGVLLSRRMLAPVSRASAAARSLAEGLLETRLPVETHDEFGTLAISFNEMAQALEEKINELSHSRERERRFTANVAHELRTPIGALVGEASLVRDQLDEIPPGARRPVELLIEDVRRLRRLVEELMEISLFDAGRQMIEVERVNVSALVDSLILRRGWADAVTIDAEPVTIDCDRRRLERIVGNLVDNAIKYGRKDVLVCVRQRDGAIEIDVADRGPGIPHDHIPHLFDRFFKADPARAGSGTGLGLSIVHENVRLLGGSVGVHSTVGEGSTFTVTLPATMRGSGESVI